MMASLTSMDIAFKKIFASESNKDILMDFINSITHEDDQVHRFEMMNPYNEQDDAKPKLSILAIKTKGPSEKYFNVETQVLSQIAKVTLKIAALSKEKIPHLTKLSLGKLDDF